MLTRISRAAMMGLAWAPCWVIAGLLPFRLIAGELDPEHIGGPLYAGFICGAVFSALAGVAAGRRRLDELRPQQAAAWGAASGLFVGVLPFVVGDNGRYQNGWSVAIVATSVVAARIVANRRVDERSFVPTAIMVAVITGLLAGVLPWILTTGDRLERFMPVAIIVTLSALGALSALVSSTFARPALSEVGSTGGTAAR